MRKLWLSCLSVVWRKTRIILSGRYGLERFATGDTALEIFPEKKISLIRFNTEVHMPGGQWWSFVIHLLNQHDHWLTHNNFHFTTKVLIPASYMFLRKKNWHLTCSGKYLLAEVKLVYTTDSITFKSFSKSLYVCRALCICKGCCGCSWIQLHFNQLLL